VPSIFVPYSLTQEYKPPLSEKPVIFVPKYHDNLELIALINFFLIFIMVMTGISTLIMPLSVAIGLIVPAARVHMIAKDEFAAGFQFKEWWLICRENWGGFVVALAIIYVLMAVMGIVMQILMITIVLICLVPFFILVISMDYSLIHYVVFTQAYKHGNDKLAIEPKTP
jgi:uncharacterized protein DUF4013